MEQQADARALIERGNALLIQGQVTEANDEFARAAHLDPSLVGAHMGLAETNLALGQYGVVYMACRQVQQIAPESADAFLARAILFVLDRRYDAAITELNRVASLDPARAYAHALRGYCLRHLNQNYDASLAEAKAARLSGTRELGELFPKVETAPAIAGAPSASPANVAVGAPPESNTTPSRWDQRQGPRPWDQRSGVERQMVRARFMTRGRSPVTLTLVAINIAVYLICAAFSGDLLSPASASNPIYQWGALVGAMMQQDPTQAYRLLTSMFLHYNYLHIGLNMWSLYAVGIITEQIFGSRRFAFIYFASGLAGGLAEALLQPNVAAIGASGAIFGIFGAFGAFVLLRRRALGSMANALIGQWLFFLVINLAFTFYDPSIAKYDHLGGLAVGLVIGWIFVATAGRLTRKV